eukprot:TRINITY_DN1816_c0_g1_i1.p1 TRINITY_DN1816_c0_g1~~TRINITY_DN1816_c0_g1_i1.p1  ORF type:complete len:423 (-),score=65.57 TRINITY_DN1816_c0_g1_i1:42-1148(-)
MALCMAESLIAKRGVDLVDQLDRYTRWYQEGHLSSNGTCFDIGMTTRAALNRFGKSRQAESGGTDAKASGNGSLMRLAPTPLFFGPSKCGEAVEACGTSSKSTHGGPEAVSCCRYYGGLIVGALQGVDKETLLGEMYCPAEGGRAYWDSHPLAPETVEVARGSFKKLQPPEIVNSGFAVKAMEAALWAFYTTTTFEQGALTAVNLGNDADTVGAIYGQLAGAFYGVQGIPTDWLEKCTFAPLLQFMADTLLALSRSGDIPNDFTLLKEAYDNLEEAYRPLHRRFDPCPRMYTSTEEVDADAQHFTSDFAAAFLSGDTAPLAMQKRRLLRDFTMRIDERRAVVALRAASRSPTAYSVSGNKVKFVLGKM